MVPMWMFANAIACGNTFILKPSEKDPSPSLFLAELLQQAGLPDGVFNVVQGDKVAVDRILEHPEIKAVSFVGSTPVARYIYETGTKHGKRVQALGGAKNHMVVLPDADIGMAADAAVSAAYGSAGERCMAISVVVAVGDQTADALIAAIKERMPRIKVGPGLEEGVEMGPLITREHRDKVASYIENAPKEGASVVVDGRQDPIAQSEGFFLGPSLIDHARPGMKCYDDEIFGPVLSVVRVKTYDEALKLINEHPYGNGTAIFTRDGGCPAVPVRGGGRHGGHQRAHPGAGGLLQLWRLEGQPVRRPAHVRPRRGAVLHPRQGGHQPLARPQHQQGGSGLPAGALAPEYPLHLVPEALGGHLLAHFLRVLAQEFAGSLGKVVWHHDLGDHLQLAPAAATGVG